MLPRNANRSRRRVRRAISTCPARLSHGQKPASSSEIGFGDFEHLAAPFRPDMVRPTCDQAKSFIEPAGRASTCKQYNVACGHPHVDTKNIEELLDKGFRYLMPASVYSYAALDLGRKPAGRA
jgi:hypothetical protein